MRPAGQPGHPGWWLLSLLAVQGLVGCSVLLDFDEEADLAGADVGDVLDAGELDAGELDAAVATDLGEDLAEVLEDGGTTDAVTPEMLFQGTCTAVIPAEVTVTEALSEDFLLLGAVLPLSGGLSPYGPSMRDGVDLAIQEINQSGGLFGVKLAALVCDSATDSDIATEATRHLAEVVGVPAIVGPAGSTMTIEAFQNAAHGAETVVISPSASSPEISQIADDDLLWRTVPSDEEQGKALASAIVDGAFERVAVVSRDDAYGNGLRERIQSELCGALGFDCAQSYKGFVYQPPEEDVFDLGFVDALAAFDPSLIVMISYLEDGVAGIHALSALGFERYWVTDGMKSDELSTAIDDDAVVCQLLGTSPAPPTTFYSGFTTNFETKFGLPPGIFVANAYDALYVVAYAAAAALDMDEALPGTPAPELDGPAIVAGMKRLSGEGAEPFDVGRADWNAGIQALAAAPDAEIDLTGASGTLTFDPDTGQPSGPVEFWRFDVAADAIASLGVIYSAESGYVPLPPESLAREGVCEP